MTCESNIVQLVAKRFVLVLNGLFFFCLSFSFFYVFRDFNDGFTDDYSAQVYAEIETTVLEFADQIEQVNHASCSPSNHNHCPNCPKKRRDWQLFSCDGQLEDIRFVIPESESSEIVEEKHTTRITQIKSFLDHYAKEIKSEYKVKLTAKTCDC